MHTHFPCLSAGGDGAETLCVATSVTCRTAQRSRAKQTRTVMTGVWGVPCVGVPCVDDRCVCVWGVQSLRLISGVLTINISRVGQNHIYTVYMRFFGREIIKYTVKYGVYIRFWPTPITSEVVSHGMSGVDAAHIIGSGVSALLLAFLSSTHTCTL